MTNQALKTHSETFASARTQRDLSRVMGTVKLSKAEWIELANDVTGRKFRSGIRALDAVHQHYSDRLLLRDRVDQVQKALA